jgi:hypothetical protein
MIQGVTQSADLERQTTAPDASVEFAAQLLQGLYPPLQIGSPFPRQALPVGPGGSSSSRQRVHRLAYGDKRQTQALSHFDDRHPPQNIALVATLIS